MNSRGSRLRARGVAAGGTRHQWQAVGGCALWGAQVPSTAGCLQSPDLRWLADTALFDSPARRPTRPAPDAVSAQSPPPPPSPALRAVWLEVACLSRLPTCARSPLGVQTDRSASRGRNACCSASPGRWEGGRVVRGACGQAACSRAGPGHTPKAAGGSCTVQEWGGTTMADQVCAPATGACC